MIVSAVFELVVPSRIVNRNLSFASFTTVDIIFYLPAAGLFVSMEIKNGSLKSLQLSNHESQDTTTGFNYSKNPQNRNQFFQNILFSFLLKGHL